MPNDKPPQPETPCTTTELLDDLVALNGQQAVVYKRLAGGIAYSFYTIAWDACARKFDAFVSIAGGWDTMSRKKFIEFHGDGEHIWHLDG